MGLEIVAITMVFLPTSVVGRENEKDSNLKRNYR